MNSGTALYADAFHKAASISRATLYGSQCDRQLPAHLQSDARVPFLGFCGPCYRSGGVVVLAINPGGGGDTYSTRTSQDSELIPLIERFVASSGAQLRPAFERMCASYAAQVQTWNLWRILQPTLQAACIRLEHSCYLNVFPYRTAKDALPAVSARQTAWREVISPLLTQLNPSIVIALGKKAGRIAQALHIEPPRLFVVPRTIGDTYISQDARAVLDAIRARET